MLKFFLSSGADYRRDDRLACNFQHTFQTVWELTVCNTCFPPGILKTLCISNCCTLSRYLDDVSLHHLINALCSLSLEAMEMAYGNNKVKASHLWCLYHLLNLFNKLPSKWSFLLSFQEPSLFAVAKLLETGLVNMDRIEILWRPLTGHLLEVYIAFSAFNKISIFSLYTESFSSYFN